jgi:hypothetical protein
MAVNVLRSIGVRIQLPENRASMPGVSRQLSLHHCVLSLELTLSPFQWDISPVVKRLERPANRSLLVTNFKKNWSYRPASIPLPTDLPPFRYHTWETDIEISQSEFVELAAPAAIVNVISKVYCQQIALHTHTHTQRERYIYTGGAKNVYTLYIITVAIRSRKR